MDNTFGKYFHKFVLNNERNYARQAKELTEEEETLQITQGIDSANADVEDTRSSVADEEVNVENGADVA